MPPSFNIPRPTIESNLPYQTATPLQPQERASQDPQDLPTVWLVVGILLASFIFNTIKPILFPSRHLQRHCNPAWFTWWVPKEARKRTSLEWREKWSSFSNRRNWGEEEEREGEEEKEGWADIIGLLREEEEGDDGGGELWFDHVGDGIEEEMGTFI